MSSSENNNSTGSGGVARFVEVASSALSLVVASSITMYALRGRFVIIMLIVFAWVTLPYIAFFVVTTYLYSKKPNTALPRAAATISILMLAFTSLVYIDGMWREMSH